MPRPRLRPKPNKAVLGAAALVLWTGAWIHHWGNQWQPRAAVPGGGGAGAQRCCVVNPVDFHADVAAGLAYAFEAAGCNVTSYMHDGYKIKEAMSRWYQGNFRNVSMLVDDICEFDVAIIVTVVHYTTHGSDFIRRALLNCPHQRFLVVMNNPAFEARSREFRSLVFDYAVRSPPNLNPPRLQAATIAPGAATFTKSLLDTLHSAQHAREAVAEVLWMPPLFPLPQLPPPTNASLRNVCIQGTIDFRRRNYVGVIHAMEDDLILSRLRTSHEALLLLGGGPNEGELTIPPSLTEHVRILSYGMDYEDFYAVLSCCRAVLTAFATDEYLVNKASSSVAAALQVGAPLLGDARILAAYSFLDHQSAMVFDPPANATWPDPASEGAKRALELASRHGQAQEEPPAGAPGDEQVQVGFLEALSRALDPHESLAAHEAALALKQRMLRRNVEVASSFLADAAQLRAAPRA